MKLFWIKDKAVVSETYLFYLRVRVTLNPGKIRTGQLLGLNERRSLRLRKRRSLGTYFNLGGGWG